MVLGSIPLKENIIPDTIVDPWLLFLLLSLWSYKIPGKDAGRDDNLSIRSDLPFFLIICFIQIYMFNFEKVFEIKPEHSNNLECTLNSHLCGKSHLTT